MISRDELIVRALLMGYRGVLRPVLFSQDPEEIHHQIIGLLGQLPGSVLTALEKVTGERTNPVTVAGISFPGRVGVAAGLDKDAEAARAWAALGFGFAELGTVTAHAQPGNRKPRVFRLPASHALINRMGFNNAGVEAMAARLHQWGVRRGNDALRMPIGVSIGKTKVTPVDEAVADYLTSLRTIAGFADYVAVNVSSPNTPHLRDLQGRRRLRDLAKVLVASSHELDADNPIPIFLKVAPDLSNAEVEAAIEVCLDEGISGIIATNTTVTRQFLHPSELHLSDQAGGLSGAPLFRKALRIVETISDQTDLPVMGCGGILTPADAQAFFDAGATLVQVYTGFIYHGAALVRGINTLTTPGRR